jgi:phosphatidylglycerophosphate synthase
MNALILCDPENGSRRIAALTLLDRLVVAAHRGGCESITIVCDGAPPTLSRSTALGIASTVAPAMPEIAEPTLLIETSALIQAKDVKRVIAEKARLVSQDGIVLPVAVITDFDGLAGGSLKIASSVKSEGVALPVTDAVSAARAERALWASLGSSTDGLVDTWFNRPLGRLLSKTLIHTPVSPNQVSVFAILVGVVAGWFFTRGSYQDAVIGAILLQLSAAIDCVDGDIARIVFKESALGKWLDIIGDQVVHIAVFIGIGVGLWRMGVDDPVIPLAISAGVGVVVSFLVVLRGMMAPPEKQNAKLQALIDKMTNRDFSVVLLALALADRMNLFLWMVGIGVHVFWVVALGVQLTGGGKPKKQAE